MEQQHRESSGASEPEAAMLCRALDTVRPLMIGLVACRRPDRLMLKPVLQQLGFVIRENLWNFTFAAQAHLTAPSLSRNSVKSFYRSIILGFPVN